MTTTNSHVLYNVVLAFITFDNVMKMQTFLHDTFVFFLFLVLIIYIPVTFNLHCRYIVEIECSPRNSGCHYQQEYRSKGQLLFSLLVLYSNQLSLVFKIYNKTVCPVSHLLCNPSSIASSPLIQKYFWICSRPHSERLVITG